MSSYENRARQLRETRGAVYGPTDLNHETIGKMWTAVLHQVYGERVLPHDIPGWAVSLMMAALKVNRLACSPHHEDSHDDAKVYLDITLELSQDFER